MASIGGYHLEHIVFQEDRDADMIYQADVYFMQEYIGKWDEASVENASDWITESHYIKMSELAEITYTNYPILFPKQLYRVFDNPADFYWTPQEFMYALLDLTFLEKKHLEKLSEDESLLYCSIQLNKGEFIFDFYNQDEFDYKCTYHNLNNDCIFTFNHYNLYAAELKGERLCKKENE